ncbi:MAG: phosphoglucosamine mutase [Clostridiales bacterium]|nr:phosphoglucosamine mutase [Clostridiales bacterium]
MGKYFGTDGFRGEANVTLLPSHAYQIGRFLGWYYGARVGKRCRIVIGKDTRRSGYMLESALSSGIISSGGDVYMMWVTTTPSVSYITRTEGFDCGVMISASHNPFYDNGIKLLNSRGEKMDEETILQIEAYMDGETPSIPMASRENIGSQFDFEAGRNRYTGYLISQGIYNFRGIKVGLDCANGSAWRIAQNVFNALGAEVTIMGNQPNGTNINEGVGSPHIEGLQALVRENHLDVGFAYDGDADRCLCVDEKGNVVNGDLILYIYGRYMKERGHLLTNTVVTTVMSNFGLYKAFDEVGIDYAKTDVGDKYVYEYMSANGCRLGGEQSGHIIFSKYATTGDGILTSLKMMQAMIGSKKTLSELAAPVKIYPQKLENVRVKSKPEAQSDPAVQAAVQAVADELGDSGRILVRESGTEPLIRVMVEAETQEECDAYVKRVTDVIIARGHQAINN